MSEDREKKATEGVPRTPGSSPVWYAAAGVAVVLAFLVGLWFDRQRPNEESAEPARAGHPPVGRAPSPGGAMGGAMGGAARQAYDSADAEEVWAGSCGVCHGADGEPTPAAVALDTPDLRDGARLAGKSDADIEKLIREGGERMPAYGDTLPDATIHALVAKVRSLGAR